jgi:hypothetical protein
LANSQKIKGTINILPIRMIPKIEAGVDAFWGGVGGVSLRLDWGGNYVAGSVVFVPLVV